MDSMLVSVEIVGAFRNGLDASASEFMSFYHICRLHRRRECTPCRVASWCASTPS